MKIADSNVTFGSVCSGIEAASVAWEPLGWKAAWLAEIEPFPCAVLAHHYPDTPNLGDMTALPERIRAGEVPAPTVFTGGTPCQAFSVAGKRESLADARGNLSLTFCEIANAIDAVRHADGREPCVVLWENVPGVLSTSDNAFGCFLGALAGADDALVAPGGRWSDAGVVLGPRRTVAWRILDAQFFGLAQRRRRVFVVASARDEFDPGAVLLEFDGVRRDSAPRREAGEGAARGAAGGVGVGVDFQNCADTGEVCGTLMGEAQRKGGEGFDASEDGTGRGTPLVPVSVALRGREGGAAAELGDDVAFTLRASEGGGDKPHVMVPVREVAATLGGRMRGQDDACADNLLPVAFTQNQRDEVRTMDIAGALAAEPGAKQQTYVAFHCDAQADQLPGPETDTSASASLTCSQRAAVAWGISSDALDRTGEGDGSAAQRAGLGIVEDASPTLRARPNNSVATAMQVRRLTPVECERLQGFPDDYTAIPWRKKPAADCPDGPRYKALGNSWAVPCVRWIGARIDAQLRVVNLYRSQAA